jgi:hypothetical protein
MGEQGNRNGVHSAGCKREEPGSETDTSSKVVYRGGIGKGLKGFRLGDSGTAARFFPNFDADPFVYRAKASRSDRGEGNTHNTVKSTPLMRWLCRLATPPSGVILDPFAGSGSTGKAAILEGFDFIGIEQDPQWLPIAKARIEAITKKEEVNAGSDQSSTGDDMVYR